MKFIKKSILLFMVITGFQLPCMDNTIKSNKQMFEEIEDVTNYSDQSKYLHPDIDFEMNYLDEADGCKYFLDSSLTECIIKILPKNNVGAPYLFADFSPAMQKINNEIENAKIDYLTNMVKMGKTNADLADDPRFQYLVSSPSTDFVLASSKLPYLESIEKNNDILVNLLIIHNPDLNTIDWDQKFPELIQGCEIFHVETPQDTIHASLNNIDRTQLSDTADNSAVFKTLQNATANTEEQIVQALKNNEINIKEALDNAIKNKTSINPAIIPALSYLIKNRQLSCIHQNFNAILMYVNDKFIDAIQKNNQEVFQVLFAAGTDVNTQNIKGESPLYDATRKNRPDIVQLLLDAGADINIKGPSGNTPLYYAINANYPDIVQLLFNAGADVNSKKKEQS